jgi:hypothetical protein
MTAKKKRSRRTDASKRATGRRTSRQRTPRATPGPEPLRLLLRTRSEMTVPQVAKVLRRIAGRAVRVEPLYAKPGSRKAQTEFLARIALGAGADRTPAHAFEMAHRARDESGGRFIWVEPDVQQAPRVTFPDVKTGPVAADPSVVGDVGDFLSGLCAEKATPPVDRYWHLRRMNVQQAWDFSATNGAAPRGLGIRIGHLDTGWTTHQDLEPSLDLRGQFDFVDNDSVARDELAKGNPFHGSRTGSVIASTFTGNLPDATAPFPGDLAGVAPNAKLVPIRVIKKVVVFFNGDVARGIRHAADSDCQVISMSLGGIAGPVLQDAVRHAVAKNVIVCAAAGNCVRAVVQPASFPETIAVAATNSNNRAWKGSCRGAAVDITAPGAQVWTAARPTDTNPRPIDQGEGTSFAVAAVAGIAAMWLAHHGRDSLIDFYRGANVPLQFVFRHVIQRTARDIGLPKNQFGAGFVDAEAALRFPLPNPQSVSLEANAVISAVDPFDAVVGGLLEPVPPLVRNLATVGLRTGDSSAERDLLLQEFAQICFDHPNAHDAFRRGLMLAGTAAASTADVSDLLDAGGIAKYASPRLRARLTRR